MAKFKKILSFLKGSKKRKSVVIHDSRTIRNNEIPFGGLAGNGNMRYGATTGRPMVGNGAHYEQFLYVDDVKNGGLKKRTLSVAPSVVSSSNYTQTDQEFSDTLSHLRSESSRFERLINRNGSGKVNGKPLASRVNGIGNAALNKNTINIRKPNKSFTLRQDPIEEEKIIVEVQDNNKEEIEIDEDELIAAVQEFDNERKRNSGESPVSTQPTEQGTFIIKEDKEDEDGNQSFIIKNVNDDVHSKKLSFIISSTHQQGFNGLEDVEEENEENLNSGDSYLLTTPNLSYSNNQEKSSNDDVNIEVEGMEALKKDYLSSGKEKMFDKSTGTKESLIQFQPPEFSITNEKVYNYRNNDLIKTIFKKIPHHEEKGKNTSEEEDDSDDEVLGNLKNKRKVNFVINNKTKATGSGSTLTKKLSTKSSDAVFMNHTPKPILISSPTLGKSTTTTTTTTGAKESVNRALSLDNKAPVKRLNSTGSTPKTKSSDESIPSVSSRREINELNENLKQSSSAYSSAVPSSNNRNIFFMPLPRPSQATLLDFGSSAKNSPALKKSNLYSHTNHSVNTFQTTNNKESSLATNRRIWNENNTSSTKSKDNNLFSAPLQASIPVVKSPKEVPISTFSTSNTKIGSHKYSTPFSATSLYASKYKKEKTIPSAQASSTPYILNKTETQSTLAETSSSHSFISEIPKEETSRDRPYILSPNISIEEDGEKDFFDQQSNSSITSNNEEGSYAYDNYRLNSRSREESLRNVKEYVKSLDENPDSDSLFSTPLAYRKRYEKYGSLRSRTSSRSRQTGHTHSGNTSFSTIGGSLKSSNALKTKHSSQSNASDLTEGSSLTEYSNSNYSEAASSFSVQTNSTNRTAPTQNSIYSREYYLSTKKYNKNKPLPVPAVQKFKNSIDDNNNTYGESLSSLRKEKFNSDSTIVNSYNKKYNNKSSSTKQGKHQNNSSVSSASTLACSPLPVPRSLLNNSNNLNKLSLMAADGNYFDDFMKDLNNMSLNDLISKYEQRTKE